MKTLKEENKDLRISFESNGFIRSTRSMTKDKFITKWSERIHISLMSEFIADCESMNHSVDPNEMFKAELERRWPKYYEDNAYHICYPTIYNWIKTELTKPI